MAKGIGLIGNFRGKVGNMVGYNLKDSNNKQTQGVRVYQPIVKNPKTYGQAEQRAKLAPINATYRMLKMIIDRGQESKAYGNKSRLAWLSEAMKSGTFPWFEKGATTNMPVICRITKGTLPFNEFADVASTDVRLHFYGTKEGETSTIGNVSSALIAGNSPIKNGDQLTFVVFCREDDKLTVSFDSIVIDTTSTDALPSGFTTDSEFLKYNLSEEYVVAGAIILSRTDANGNHLRSTSSLVLLESYVGDEYGEPAKEAAIKSYMTGGSNTDWAEESLQG